MLGFGATYIRDLTVMFLNLQVSLPRVLAFTKRLTTMACQLGSNGSIAVMGLIRAILNVRTQIVVCLYMLMIYFFINVWV